MVFGLTFSLRSQYTSHMKAHRENVVCKANDGELLYHDCFDENTLPCPWNCRSPAVDTVLLAR